MKASAVLAIILFCLLLPIQALCTDKPVNDKSKLNVQKAVDAVRKELESKLGNPVPSLNVLIQTRDGLIFVSSVHDGVKPVTKDMNFRFASNTKSFTAAAILKMYQDGWLNYKDKITDIIPGSKKTTYVPDSPDWDIPYKSSITIEQLLQHSSGVFDVDNDANPSWGGDTYTEFKQKSNHNHQFKVDEFTAELVSKNLYYFTPGSGYHYSNTEYAILSRIISRVYSFFAGTAKTYEDYLNDFIVGKKAKIPLNIHFPISAADSVLPSPCVPGTERSQNGTVEITDFNMSAQVGEGNGYGTINDLNIFIRSLMKGSNVLNTETVTLMQKDTSLSNQNYSLGCTFTPNIGYGHNGARVGNLSLMAYDPAYDISLVVYLPLIDTLRGDESFIDCVKVLYDTAWNVRSALGYPGNPNT